MANSLRPICQWEIQNLSFCSLKKGELLMTCAVYPRHPFNFDILLYPRGNLSEDHIGVYLHRSRICPGPEKIEGDFQIAFLNKNGSILNVKNIPKQVFARGDLSSIDDFIMQNKIFGAEKEKILPQDILVIELRVWLKDYTIEGNVKRLNARTTFEIIHRSFFCTFDKFSAIEPEEINSWIIFSDKIPVILMKFELSAGLKYGINLKTKFKHESVKSFSFEIFVIDSEGKKVNFGSHKFFSSDIKKKITQLISAEQLMQKASQYLPNDVLSLACEYAYSTGTISYIIEVTAKESHISLNESRDTETLMDDLKSMYSDAILCDVELRTSTQTFPAHRSILSARSPVFRKIFSTDMREKNCGHVDIVDLEDDTVQRMLLYIYTGSLGEFEFESVYKLYSAADKYAIISLKNKCVCAMMKIVSPSKACKLLGLADLHQDDYLKCAAQNYILGHDKEVFASLEWKDFMATNIHLAADVMFQFTQIKTK